MYRFYYLSTLLIGVFLTACATQHTVQPTVSLGLQDVTSFDVTIDHSIIHSLIADKVNNRVSIRYLSSDDGGEHWRNAVNVATDTQAISVRGNDVQIAAAGDNLLAIWQVKGELPSMGAMVSYYSHDAGKSWHKGENPAVDNNGDQSHLDIIADNKGLFHVVWLADPEENGYQSLRYARSLDNGEHWQASLKLDDSTCSCCWNTFALSPTGEINILYRDMIPRDMALMQSADNGATWQRTSTVGEFNWKFDGCPHIGGGLAIADNGELYSSVWTGVDNKVGLYTLSSNDNGKAWTSPQAIGNQAARSDITVKNQHVALIWDEREPDGTSIFTALSHDKGVSWSTPQRLSPKDEIATHPRIVATEQGFLALWTEKHPKRPNKWVMKILNLP
jgi:hypothetical protein